MSQTTLEAPERTELLLPNAIAEPTATLTIHLHLHTGSAAAPLTRCPTPPKPEPLYKPTNGTVQPKPESPETEAARDQCKSIAARYASLSANERAVFDLRYEGVRWQQVADRLGVSIKAAERSGDRIKRKLGKAGVAELQSTYAAHLHNRGGSLCHGCHFRCAEVFGQGGAA